MRSYLLTPVLRLLTSRLFICSLNTCLIVVLTQIIKTAFPLLSNYHKNEEILHNIIFNSVEFFILFGVILEERDFMMEKIGLYPIFNNVKEDLTDEACHAYGFAILIVSSLIVIPVNAIAIHNDVIDTKGIAIDLYYLTFSLLFIQILVLVKFTFRLLKIQLNKVSTDDDEK
ncbi:hypothetical protein [Pseudanabaena sp. 'Roaring Creek']|uniref:hypothetical protein n=1 Tax=Pseudanabaena sp. 'Roaring Creek' TaxID=1681830 RepID=UPI0006D83B77|nr:hypothetical protein [Pseudanabaena sp. 'Roaring Creek']